MGGRGEAWVGGSSSFLAPHPPIPSSPPPTPSFPRPPPYSYTITRHYCYERVVLGDDGNNSE